MAFIHPPSSLSAAECRPCSPASCPFASTAPFASRRLSTAPLQFSCTVQVSHALLVTSSPVAPWKGMSALHPWISQQRNTAPRRAFAQNSACIVHRPPTGLPLTTACAETTSGPSPRAPPRLTIWAVGRPDPSLTRAHSNYIYPFPIYRNQRHGGRRTQLLLRVRRVAGDIAYCAVVESCPSTQPRIAGQLDYYRTGPAAITTNHPAVETRARPGAGRRG
jgi:hypothetical protein